jgi:protein involved in polysaccharide export with SLBB domain
MGKLQFLTFKQSTYLFLIFLIFTSLPAQNQTTNSSLDEDFLDSLPEDVQSEISSENEGDAPLEKLFNSKSSLLKNKAALEILKKQIDELENRMLDEDGLANDKFLSRFGDSFFSSIQSTFMPINIPNFDGDYILGVGDKININIIGNNPSFYEGLIVDRDGSISIESYGKVVVAGKTFSSAEDLISKFIQSRLIGGEIFVSLKELRDIQVVILGNAINPGIYTLSGGSNLMHALNVSGGINANGSFRKIKLIRKNNEVENVDLYDTLVFGDNKIFDYNLRSGDSIFVQPLEFSVPISGGINAPGIYDITAGETLQDLLAFAGGFSQDSFGVDYVTVRRDGKGKSSKLSINKDELQSIKLQPQDSISVPAYSKSVLPLRTVTLSGAVVRPGEYSIEDDETMYDLLQKAGGYKVNAYEFGGKIFRKSTEELSNNFSKRIYSDTINYLVSSLGQGTGTGNSAPVDGEFLGILIEEFQSSEPIKRIITEFDLEKIRNNPLKNLRLEDEDVIDIPEVPQHVYLFGDFNQQVILPYDPNLQISDYISLAAGKKTSATEHLILIDPNGLSYYYQKPRFDLFVNNPEVYPGSIIYLPRELGKIEGITFAAAVAPILSSLTLSLASINAINNN